MAKRYSFPEPACMECRHHQYLGNGLSRSRYCGGFPKRKSPKRFRSSDPQRKAPKWCPRRLSPPVCRVYGFADEQSQVMDILSRNRFNPKKERYISVASSHYKLLLEKPLGMKAKAFYEAAETGDVYDILPEDVLEPGIVVEIDDGLKPYYFYFLSWSRVVPVYSFDLARVQKPAFEQGIPEGGHDEQQ